MLTIARPMRTDLRRGLQRQAKQQSNYARVAVLLARRFSKRQKASHSRQDQKGLGENTREKWSAFINAFVLPYRR